MRLGLFNDFENVPEQRSRTTEVQNSFGFRNRLNQDVRTSHLTNTTAPRTFGLQSRISSFKSNEQLNENADEMNRNMSMVSRTFGLISDDVGHSQNNERLHQEFRRNDRSLMQRPFGLQASFSRTVTEDNLRGNDCTDFMNYRRSNVNISTRTFDVGSENLNMHDNERLNHDIRTNNYVNSSLMLKSNGLSSRHLTANSGLLSDGRLNHRNNGMNHSTSRTFGPSGSSGLSMGLQRQDSEGYTDTIIDGGGFKRPVMSRVIRGRNSTLSSRLFNSENTDRHCKDLSNINGFLVSHISQGNGDSLSRSRFVRNNCLDNQSISHSVVSGASAKAQVMNLLENLHYSILNIGPHVTAAALRLEFDKAKQNLENISEMSFAPSTWNGDAASVISHSSKSICPTAAQPATSDTLNGGLLHLRSSTELLQSLISGKESGNKNRTKSISSRVRESDEEEHSELVFKKPRAYTRRKNSTRTTKVKTPRRGKSSESKGVSKVISLKQWYPIAVGSDLALCGVDEQGTTVKTDPIKKRVSNRKVELINGLACLLIGSPSTMVSVLPKKIISLLKNGLTDRWRVLQKELLNCQTAEEDTKKKRKSKSPKVTSSPKKKRATAHVSKKKAQTSKIVSTQAEDVVEMQTRSGRTIKPPGMFWLVPDTGSDEVTSTSTPVAPKSPKKMREKSMEETPVKRMKNVTRKSPSKGARDVSRGRKKKSPEKTKAESKHSEVKSVETKGRKKKEKEEEEMKVESSTEKRKRQNENRKSIKRKREAAGDVDVVQPKKSKLEKRIDLEVTPSSTKVKKRKTGQSPRKPSPKSTRQKTSPAKKKKETVKKKTTKNATESKKESKETAERREVTECEEDFELKLDDIEIPEIGNVSGNPQLSRSQLRLVSMETPPLKYFSNNLKILSSATPVRSPDWCISQRTESEVKQFQRRREEAFKKKIKVDVKRTVITEKTKGVQNRDVKRVMEWFEEKTVKSPHWSSRALQYIIPSRKRMEQQADEEEEEEDIETEFL